MQEEKRAGLVAVPADYKRLLNFEQTSMLSTIESYGWELKFIRRTGLENHIVVVVNPDGKTVGILEEDGTLNQDSNIEFRD